MLKLFALLLLTCCPIVELRQYTVMPGTLDRFINLFETHFVESQEADGIRLVGQFRQIGMPDKFYWIRGFSNMKQRAAALQAFYYGPVWRKYRTTANPMLLENDNVLLLQPAHPGSGFGPLAPRAPVGSQHRPSTIAVATIYYLAANSGTTFDRTFEKTIRPVLVNDGARIEATFITDHDANTFPKLPVRADANVFVSISCFKNAAAYSQFTSRLTGDPRWATVEGKFALAGMYVPPEVDVLAPAPRSAFNCSSS